MITAKQEVTSLLQQLPEDCTLEDVQYHLYVVEKIQRGLKRADEEAVVSHKDVTTRFEQWLTP